MTKLFTALTAFVLFSCSLHAERTLSLRKTVEVRGSQVVLSDLVIDSAVLSDAEKGLVILKSPLRGYKNVRPIDIAYEMQVHKSLLDVELLAPSFVKVVRVKDVDYVEKVKAGLLDALSKENPWKMFELEMEFSPSDLNKISSMSGCEFEMTSQIPNDELDSAKLTVKFTEGDKNKGSLKLLPMVRRKILAITLRNNIKKGHVIQKSDLILDRVWVSGTNEKYAVNFKDCVGYEASRNMLAGSRIINNYLIEPVFVDKGDFITVYSGNRLLNVSAKAKALSMGRRGQIIRAKNIKSGKEMDVEMTGVQTGIVK